MNILHISSANTWRGGERQIANLCAYQQEHGHQVWLMSPNDSVLYRRSFENLNRGFILLKSPFAMMPNMAKLKAICQSCNIDIIHGHDSYAHTLLWMSYQLGNLKTKSVVTRRLIKNVKARSIPKCAASGRCER